jgi:protein SCO1/2
MSKTGMMPMLRWILPTLVLMALLAFAVNWWAEASRGTLPVLGEVPAFELIDQNGQAFGRSDLSGKINIVDFFFTSCKAVCPVMNGNMAELYRSLDGTDQIRIVSVSVDPERDSLPVLRAYADSVGVGDNRWIFLRGPMDEVVQLCEKGFMLPAQGLPMGHTTRFALVDSQGRIRGYYDGMNRSSVAKLREDLRLLAD